MDAAALLFKLFELPWIGYRLRQWLVQREGGMQESQLLRCYAWRKYKVRVGMYSYGGCFSPGFNAGGEAVEIGRYCSFANNVHYFGANHPMESVSMSPYFYNASFGQPVRDIPRERLTVGHDVWVGYGVTITKNCRRIGNGAVLAAGSIVTKDVPSYAVVAGSPARILRYRFDSETQRQIEESRWWEKTPAQCMEYYPFLDNPKEFCRRLLKGTETGGPDGRRGER